MHHASVTRYRDRSLNVIRASAACQMRRVIAAGPAFQRMIHKVRYQLCQNLRLLQCHYCSCSKEPKTWQLKSPADASHSPHLIIHSKTKAGLGHSLFCVTWFGGSEKNTSPIAPAKIDTSARLKAKGLSSPQHDIFKKSATAPYLSLIHI